jgi:site-specific DNA recombinase
MFSTNTSKSAYTRDITQIKVAIYVRVSTREQAEKGYSIQEQINACRNYCDQQSWKVVRIYKENGVSGKSLDRPKLQLLFDDAKKKQFDVIVFWRSDRLTRSMRDLCEIVNYFEEIEIKISCVTERFDTTTADGKLIIHVMGALAEHERQITLERSKIGIRARAREGKWKGGKTPFGYCYDTQTEKLRIDEKETKTVKQIFKLYLELGTINDVTRYLNKNQIPTRTAEKWSNTAIGNILGRKLYTGIYSCANETINISQLRVIDDETFKQVQKQRKQRKIFGPTKFVNKRKRLDEIVKLSSFHSFSFPN